MYWWLNATRSIHHHNRHIWVQSHCTHRQDLGTVRGEEEEWIRLVRRIMSRSAGHAGDGWGRDIKIRGQGRQDTAKNKENFQIYAKITPNCPHVSHPPQQISYQNSTFHHLQSILTSELPDTPNLPNYVLQHIGLVESTLPTDNPVHWRLWNHPIHGVIWRFPDPSSRLSSTDLHFLFSFKDLPIPASGHVPDPCYTWSNGHLWILSLKMHKSQLYSFYLENIRSQFNSIVLWPVDPNHQV